MAQIDNRQMVELLSAYFLRRGEGGGGVTDHGALSGLADDDHPQYAIPSGVVSQYAGSVAPSGYLLCKGQAVSRTTYADLFTAIGTTYGAGDGSTTFNLPNLQGRVPAGVSDTDADFDLADTGGAKTHTLVEAEMPSHTHIQNAHNHTQAAHNHGIRYDSFKVGSGSSKASVNGPYIESSVTILSATPTIYSKTATNQNTGGGGAHNNLQPYIALNYIIKT